MKRLLAFCTSLMLVMAAAVGAEPAKGLVLGLHAKNKEHTYEKELRQIAEMGADSVLVIVSGYQEGVKSQEIAFNRSGVPSRERVVDVIRRAHSYDLEVLLLPIVLIRRPQTSKDWRGAINPPDRDVWFANYTGFITYYAEIARDAKADALAAGSEYVTMEYWRDDWVRIIEQVREIYPGMVFYSANWDHYEEVTFWDRLDAVALTSYHTVSKKSPPSRKEMDKTWRGLKEKLLAWQTSVGKPLIFTEVGYPSQKGAARQPWNYYGSKTVDLDVQRTCLEAFLDAWDGVEGVSGIFIFEWWGDGGPNDTGYTPWGKPAEALLRKWFTQSPPASRGD